MVSPEKDIRIVIMCMLFYPFIQVLVKLDAVKAVCSEEPDFSSWGFLNRRDPTSHCTFRNKVDS